MTKIKSQLIHSLTIATKQTAKRWFEFDEADFSETKKRVEPARYGLMIAIVHQSSEDGENFVDDWGMSDELFIEIDKKKRCIKRIEHYVLGKDPHEDGFNQISYEKEQKYLKVLFEYYDK